MMMGDWLCFALLLVAAFVDRASAACGTIVAGCVAGEFCATSQLGVQTCENCAVRSRGALRRCVFDPIRVILAATSPAH